MVNPNDVRTIIFDMDGTLVPSLAIVYEGIRKAFTRFGWELKYSAEDINQFIGTASGELYKAIIPPEHVSLWPELRDQARAEYSASFRERAETFPGVRETLETLRKRGYRLVLYSNASTLYFDMVVSTLNIRDYFDYAECVHENNLTKPELVRKIREKFSNDTTAIVGDRYFDIDAARETGSLSVGVRYGYGGNEPEQADMTIDRFDELLAIFDRRLPVFEEILDTINRKKTGVNPFVIGISGIDGAGKTRFTGALKDFLLSRNYKIQVINLDDFHNPKEYRYAGESQADNYYNRSFDIGSIIEKLLTPLRQGQAFSTKMTLLDWHTDRYDIEKEYSFDHNTIVLFEGVFLFRQELSPYVDYRIFLEIPFEESKRRAMLRDYEVSELEKRKYDEKYLPAQRKYLDEFPPAKTADMIIDNANWEFPQITFVRSD